MGTDKRKWNQTKRAVKKQWGKLTDDDLTIIAGQRDQLVGKIQERYGIAKEETDKQVKTWEAMKVNEPEDFESQEKRKASLAKDWIHSDSEPRRFSALTSLREVPSTLGAATCVAFRYSKHCICPYELGWRKKRRTTTIQNDEKL